MSLTTLKPVTCNLPPVGAPITGTHSKPTIVSNRQQPLLPLLQVKGKEKTLVQEAPHSNTSRREMMNLTAAALGVLTLLSAAPAEARTKNPSIRQKIFEKLQKLREKAGLSKRKDEDIDEKSKYQEKPSKPTNEKEEAKLKTKIEAEDKKPKLNGAGDEKKTAVPSKERPSIPSLPNILNGKVETTLP